MKSRLELNKSKAILFLLLLTVATVSHFAKNTPKAMVTSSPAYSQVVNH